MCCSLKGDKYNGGFPHRKFIAGVGEGRGDAILGFLDRRVWQTDERNQSVAIAAVDFHINRVGINAA